MSIYYISFQERAGGRADQGIEGSVIEGSVLKYHFFFPFDAVIWRGR